MKRCAGTTDHRSASRRCCVTQNADPQVTHVFSHVRHTMHIEHARAPDDMAMVRLNSPWLMPHEPRMRMHMLCVSVRFGAGDTQHLHA